MLSFLRELCPSFDVTGVCNAVCVGVSCVLNLGLSVNSSPLSAVANLAQCGVADFF